MAEVGMKEVGTKEVATVVVAASGTPPPVSFVALFRFATAMDVVMTVIAAILGLACGALQPAFALVLGQIFNSINTTDPAAMTAKVDQLSWIILVMGAGMGVGSYIALTLCLTACANQGRRLREAYFQALLRQDMGWMDTNRPGEAASRLANDTVEFQVGVGEQLNVTCAF